MEEPAPSNLPTAQAPATSAQPRPATVSSAEPLPRGNNHLGLIVILTILAVAIAAFLYITFRPSTTADLQGSAAAGTNDQSLNNDYNNVTNQLNQNDQDLDSGDSSLNDQQPTITDN